MDQNGQQRAAKSTPGIKHPKGANTMIKGGLFFVEDIFKILEHYYHKWARHTEVNPS